MPFVNSPYRVAFIVTDNTGAPVAGLAPASFAVALRRRSGDAMVAAAETVTITEDANGGGRYWATVTPTVGNTLYRYESISHPTYTVDLTDRQFEVYSGIAAAGGPYLTTRASYKSRFLVEKADGTDDPGLDDQIDQLLPIVTAEIERYCDYPSFFGWTGDEYPSVPTGRWVSRIPLDRYPVSSIAGLWVSTSLPRVYDATTLYVEGTDFLLDPGGPGARPAIVLVAPLWFPHPSERCVKVTYTAGYDTIPSDVEDAANLAIEVRLRKAKEHSYDVSSRNLGDGAIEYQTKSDLILAMQEKLRAHRRITLA